jgi:hypothetical protein
MNELKMIVDAFAYDQNNFSDEDDFQHDLHLQIQQLLSKHRLSPDEDVKLKYVLRKVYGITEGVSKQSLLSPAFKIRGLLGDYSRAVRIFSYSKANQAHLAILKELIRIELQSNPEK